MIYCVQGHMTNSDRLSLLLEKKRGKKKLLDQFIANYILQHVIKTKREVRTSKLVSLMSRNPKFQSESAKNPKARLDYTQTETNKPT